MTRSVAISYSSDAILFDVFIYIYISNEITSLNILTQMPNRN